MDYCELWLEDHGGLKSFRVALVAPDGMEVPEGYSLGDVQPLLPKQYYISDWFEGIKTAQGKMNETAQFYNDRDIKFLFFREIRKPLK